MLFGKADLIAKVGCQGASSTAWENEKEIISSILKAKLWIPGAHVETELFVSCSCGIGSRAELVWVGGFHLPPTHGRVRSSGSSFGGAQPHGMGILGWAALDSPTAQALSGRKTLKTLGPVLPSVGGLQGIFGILEMTGIFGILEMLGVLEVLGILGILGMLGCWGCHPTHTSVRGRSRGGSINESQQNSESSSTSKSSMGYKCSPSKNEDVMNNADYSVNYASWGGCANSARFPSKTLPDLRGAGCPLSCVLVVPVALCPILVPPQQGWDSSWESWQLEHRAGFRISEFPKLLTNTSKPSGTALGGREVTKPW